MQRLETKNNTIPDLYQINWFCHKKYSSQRLFCVWTLNIQRINLEGAHNEGEGVINLRCVAIYEHFFLTISLTFNQWLWSTNASLPKKKYSTNT